MVADDSVGDLPSQQVLAARSRTKAWNVLGAITVARSIALRSPRKLTLVSAIISRWHWDRASVTQKKNRYTKT